MFDASYSFLMLLEIIISLIVVFKYKIYKSIAMIFVFCVVNTFVSPCLYFMYGGESYCNISSVTFEEYCWLSLLFVSTLCAEIILVYEKNILFMRIPRFRVFTTYKIPICVCLGSLICLLGYICVYMDKLPLFQVLLYGMNVPEMSRPNISGDIPHYFTYDSIMTIVFPMGICFLYERVDWVKKHAGLCFLCVIGFLLIGGNKGDAVFFLLFVWMYVFKFRVKLSFIAIALGLLIWYVAIKHANGANIEESVYPIILGALRRFFVTQGAMFVNRLELLNLGYDLDVETVNNVIQQYVYNISYGAAPTIFIGNLIIAIGYKFGCIVSFVIMFIVLCVSNTVDKYIKRNEKNLYLYWAVFLCWYLLGISGIEYSFFLRLVAIVFYTLMFWSLDINFWNMEKCS